MSKGHALIMGVNEVDPMGYDGKWDGKLNFCEKDAKGIADLTARLGMHNEVLLTAQVTKAALVNGIRTAAASLESGDLFLMFFSGHGNTTPDLSGDEDNRGNARDETLCLYDNQILDDELYSLWQAFAPGVRVVVLTDACHSGSVLRGGEDDLTAKGMDRKAGKMIARKNPRLYDEMRAALPPEQPVKASVLQLAGCREDQLSYESRSLAHGQFTSALLKCWAARQEQGVFPGSYADLFDAMHSHMPDTQKPVMNQLGVDPDRLRLAPALSID